MALREPRLRSTRRWLLEAGAAWYYEAMSVLERLVAAVSEARRGTAMRPALLLVICTTTVTAFAIGSSSLSSGLVTAVVVFAMVLTAATFVVWTLLLVHRPELLRSEQTNLHQMIIERVSGDSHGGIVHSDLTIAPPVPRQVEFVAIEQPPPVSEADNE